MKIGIPQELHPGERRVAATPNTVRRILKLGYEVVVQRGAGASSDFSDAAYEEAGASLVDDAQALWTEADVVAKVRPPRVLDDGTHELSRLREGGIAISFLYPDQQPEAFQEALAARKASLLAMERVPRISRAQKLDALSSMALVAGYRAVLEAAHLYGGFFGLQVTAAGRAEPAKVLIIGGGVAGLAALGAARNLGAQVRAFDTRPAVREQVESLGGEFIEFHFDESGEGEGGYAKQMSDAYLEAEQRLLAKHAAECDIVISTALIPGKPAPVLLTAEAALAMRPGSVVVDLAAERGGNCPLTEADKIVTKGGVTFVGLTDLPSRMARQSSELYGMNIVHMLDELKPKGKEFALDHSNEVIRGSLYAQDGTVLPPAPKLNPSPAPKAEAPKPARPPEDKPSGSAAPPATTHAPEVKAPSAPVSKPASAPAKKHGGHGASEGVGLPGWAVGLIGAALIGLGAVAPTEFLQHLTVFLLACVVGWHVVWSVTAALHTPLMSVTNAISGIILIGGMLLVRGQGFSATTILGLVAILVASINVAGGFLVTRRMLDMFRK